MSRFWVIYILNLYIAPHPLTPLNTEHVKNWLIFLSEGTGQDIYNAEAISETEAPMYMSVPKMYSFYYCFPFLIYFVRSVLKFLVL